MYTVRVKIGKAQAKTLAPLFKAAARQASRAPYPRRGMIFGQALQTNTGDPAFFEFSYARPAKAWMIVSANSKR